MTRAPRSASWRVQNGAAIACSSVTTVMPSRGFMSVFHGAEGAPATDETRGHRAVAADPALPGRWRRPLGGGAEGASGGRFISERLEQSQHVLGDVAEDQVGGDR